MIDTWKCGYSGGYTEAGWNAGRICLSEDMGISFGKGAGNPCLNGRAGNEGRGSENESEHDISHIFAVSWQNDFKRHSHITPIWVCSDCVTQVFRDREKLFTGNVTARFTGLYRLVKMVGIMHKRPKLTFGRFLHIKIKKFVLYLVANPRHSKWYGCFQK